MESQYGGMAACPNHPAAQAVAACPSCRRLLCGECMRQTGGVSHCSQCRPAAPYQHTPAPGYARPHSQAPSAMEHVVPTRNVPALAGYYTAVFSLIPCAGNLLGPAAIVLGSLGLKACRENPELPGRAHAITAIVLGALTTLAYRGAVLLLVVSAVRSRQG